MSTENNINIYKTPGKTLVFIAEVMLVLGSLASVGLAYTVGSIVEKLGRDELCSALACLTLIVGVVLSYLSGLMLVAFGQLVHSVHSIRKKKLKRNSPRKSK